MKNTLCILLFILGIVTQLFSQETLLTPLENTANKGLIKSETSEMSWFMLKDSLKIKIGSVQTQIQKGIENINIIMTVKMKHSPSKWIDSTIVETRTFNPVYHASYNQQRDMVLKFGENITGYYLDKQTNTKTEISEKTDKSYFDSNFYPQLIRILPLKNNYSNNISIFDYNPTSHIGFVTATIIDTEEKTISFHGEKKQVYKVKTTDDISNNSTISTYYIEKSTRALLKQEIDFKNGRMLMELVE